MRLLSAQVNGIVIVIATVHLCASLCWSAPYVYEVDVMIRFDVVAGGVSQTDTLVWGMPADVDFPSGNLELAIDATGNVNGSSTVEPISGLGMLWGTRQYAVATNATFDLTGGSWGTPVGRIAPIVGGTVRLWNTFLGDFSGLSNITGFIEDGNSGDFFNLSNGLGPDGKFQFTAAGPDGMSMTFTGKNYGGYGTGWYVIGVDTGDMTYSNGGDGALVDITGVVPYDVWMDAVNHTITLPAQPLDEGEPVVWSTFGRRIDSFTGTIEATGNFVGTAHFAGLEFTSLTVTSTDGTFEDGNSIGFDAANGLTYGDALTLVMTDQTGLFDLVISGSLISCNIDAECDDGFACTGVETCIAGACQPGTTVTCSDNGLACDGPETCQEPSGTCASGPDPCDPVTERCCEDTDVCVLVGGCCADAECDDGFACTGVETCVAGACQPGTTVTCSDNGFACDGPETCQEPSGTCASGPDLCDPVTERCCEDTDVCVLVGGCCTDAECDDGNACTTDACDPLTGCTYMPLDACSIPALSTWGQAAFVLLMLTAGTMVLRNTAGVCKARSLQVRHTRVSE